jgi:hypothetical protein
MEQRSSFNAPGHQGVVDRATLYLCRQGTRWVVVIESSRISRVRRLPVSAGDTYDARFQLLCVARRACPDAAIISTDGALESTDYEWRIDVRGVEARPGDLGEALDRTLSTGSEDVDRSAHQRVGRRCHWGLSPAVSGRPRRF